MARDAQAALVALNRTDQLPGHLQRALDNGVTQAELVELITHLAFYSGWPTAITAMEIAKENDYIKPTE